MYLSSYHRVYLTYGWESCILCPAKDLRIAKLNLPNPFQGDETLNHFENLNFGGIYDDFICVKCYLKHNVKVIPDVRFALWNPTMDEFKVIPHSPDMFQPFAASVSHDVIN